jgi:hypothetical protein
MSHLRQHRESGISNPVDDSLPARFGRMDQNELCTSASLFSRALTLAIAGVARQTESFEPSRLDFQALDELAGELDLRVREINRRQDEADQRAFDARRAA